MFILCAKCLCVKETLSNSLSTGSCKCKWEDSFVIESSILRHNLSAPDFFSQRFHLHKKEFPDQKVLMEAVVFGCCLGVGEEDGGSDLHWTDRSQPIKIIIPFDEDWCCVSDRAVLSTNLREVSQCPEKAPTRTLSLLKKHTLSQFRNAKQAIKYLC